MATREEILRELKLAPEWRLRGDAAAGQDRPVETAPMRGALPASPASPPIVAAEDPAARRARIAALDWDAFEADVAACTACGLCRSRNRAVPGVGDRRAEWLFVGEGPGAEEDATGEPFVGQAGKLLDNMLAALGMRRDANVYIANVVKCRPPGNRDPKPDEIDACRSYLQQQLDLIRPAVCVTLGRYAAQWLLDTSEGILKLRGRSYPFAHGVLIPTLHPAAALRGGATPLAQMRADLVRAKLALADVGATL